MNYRLFKQGDNQDSLFVLTEHHKLSLLSYDPATGEILTRASGDVGGFRFDNLRTEISGRKADLGPIAILDPQNRQIGLHIYDGVFRVMDLEDGQLGDSYPLRCVDDIL